MDYSTGFGQPVPIEVFGKYIQFVGFGVSINTEKFELDNWHSIEICDPKKHFGTTDPEQIKKEKASFENNFVYCLNIEANKIKLYDKTGSLDYQL